MEKPILKTFYFSSAVGLYKYSWSCPDLVGFYEATPIQLSISISSNVQIALLNSPQIVYGCKSAIPAYTDINIPLPNSINYVLLGSINNRTTIFNNMKILMRMNGTFDQEFLAIDPFYLQKLFARTYTLYALTMSFKRYVANPNYPLGLEPYKKTKERQMITIFSNTPASKVSKNIGLFGRYKVTLIYGYYVSTFPENVGISILSPQFTNEIPNDKRLYLIAGTNNRGQVFCNYPSVSGDYYGYFDLTFFSLENNTEEILDYYGFQFLFEKLDRDKI